MTKWDSTNIPVPDPLLLISAIEDIGIRFALSNELNVDLVRSAMHLISDQAKLALVLMKVSPEDRKRLQEDWNTCRVDQSMPRYLKDPVLRAYEEFLKGLIVSIKDFHPIDGDGADFHFNFEYHCEECGGYEIDIPDDPQDHSIVRCAACRKEFGTYLALSTICRWKADQELKRLKLGAYSEPTLTLTVHGSPP